VGRLSSYAFYYQGSSNLGVVFGYNHAGQLASRASDNDAYNYTPAATPSGGVAATPNGLNQLVSVGSAALSYDANGNLTSDGTSSYTYDIENRLVAKGSTVGLRYDPLGRLYELASSGNTTRFLYDGDDLVAEYNGSGTMLKRHVHGEGVDQPLVTFDGSSIADSDRHYLFADERGSIVATTSGSGGSVAVNTYDENGVPGSSNTGRFQYTGQAWLPELSLYYYKARLYSPTLGRFLQTDPIGYGSGMNMYAYVGGDPVNASDPSGTLCETGTGSIICGGSTPAFLSCVGNCVMYSSSISSNVEERRSGDILHQTKPRTDGRVKPPLAAEEPSTSPPYTTSNPFGGVIDKICRFCGKIDNTTDVILVTATAERLKLFSTRDTGENVYRVLETMSRDAIWAELLLETRTVPERLISNRTGRIRSGEYIARIGPDTYATYRNPPSGKTIEIRSPGLSEGYLKFRFSW
jgi:RHS repeat-associated protein